MDGLCATTCGGARAYCGTWGGPTGGRSGIASEMVPLMRSYEQRKVGDRVRPGSTVSIRNQRTTDARLRICIEKVAGGGMIQSG